MSMSDPLADMLTRIRNAQKAQKKIVSMASSKLKIEVARVLKDEGYIIGYVAKKENSKISLDIELKYYANKPVIESLKRLSKPGIRIYKGKNDIPKCNNGLGIIIVSTPKGVMTDRMARKEQVGGELLCSAA